MTTNQPHTIAATEQLGDDQDQILQKLADASTPGFQAEFDPDEADRAGAFLEDALSEPDALKSTQD